MKLWNALIVFFIVLFSLNVIAKTVSLDLPPKINDKDNFLICFYADYSWNGHAFFKIKDPKGEWRGYGFYPSGESLVSPVFDVGKIKNDVKQPWNEKACYDISGLTAKKVFDKVDKWKTKNYFIIGRNCLNFVSEVANSAGISIPLTGATVEDFASSLKATKNSFENPDLNSFNDFDPQTSKPIKLFKEKKEEFIPYNMSCDIGRRINSFNTHINNVSEKHPFLINNVKNQKYSFQISIPNEEIQKFSVIFDGKGKIQEFKQGLLEDATKTIETDIETIIEILGSETDRDLFNSFQISVISGKLVIKEGSFASAEKQEEKVLDKFTDFSRRTQYLVNFPETVLGFGKRKQFDVKEGEKKEIIFDGKKAEIVKDVLGRRNVLIEDKNQVNSYVIDRAGNTKGFTPKKSLEVIKQNLQISSSISSSKPDYLSDRKFSSSAGIYELNLESKPKGWSANFLQKKLYNNYRFNRFTDNKYSKQTGLIESKNVSNIVSKKILKTENKNLKALISGAALGSSTFYLEE